jgi:hypothetical protein
MKNLTQIFLDSAPSRFKLSFGINKNVFLKSVSNEIRRDKNGVKINKNCYTTFVTVDVKNNNKVLAESTFSYFNIDISKPQYATKNFIHQFNQLIEIAKAVVPADNFSSVVKKLQTVLSEDVSLFTEIKKSPSPDVKLTKKIGELQIKVVDTFVKTMAKYTKDTSDMVNLIVVTGPKGQFFDLPREDKGFISKVDGGRKLLLDSKYVRWFEEKDKVETDTSDDIGDDAVMEEEEVMVDEDQDLDDI